MSQTLQRSAQYNHLNDQHYMVQHNKQLKCICNLCSCGKHHCPRKPIKGDFETTYGREYKKFDKIQPTGQRPEYIYQQRHYAPDVLKTNYQQNYQKRNLYIPEPNINLSNSRLQQLGKKIMNTPIPFSGVSSYKDQYQPYKIKTVQNINNPQNDILSPIKSMQYPLRPSVKFQGQSSYKQAYSAPPEPMRNQNDVNSLNNRYYVKPDVPFYGESSYKQQYKAHQIPIAKRQQFYDNFRYNQHPAVKFQGTTSYKDHYTPYELDQIAKSRLSMRESDCKLDNIYIPRVNNINNQDHLYYDPELNRFV